MHTHITLVGGQPIPEYTAIKALKPDKVIYIHSNSSKIEAQRIAKEFNEIDSEYIEIDPTDFSDIMPKLRNLIQKLEEENLLDEISINISSGTKQWSTALYDLMKDVQNIKIILLSQLGQMYDYAKHEVVNYDRKLSIDTILRIHGAENYKYMSLSDFSEEDDVCVQEIEEFRANNHKIYQSINLVSDKEKKEELKNANAATWKSSQYEVSWNKSKGIVSVKLFKEDAESEIFEFKSPNAVHLFFKTGWFEYKVAKIIEKWSKSTEIRTNVVFQTKQGQDDNEVDVLVEMGNKLLFVECKTQVKNPTDIDKFSSVAKKFGGLSAKKILITEYRVSPQVIEKCTKNDVLLYSIEFEKKIKPRISIEQGLFTLLNSASNKVNKK
jgi:hypothetical protein